MATQDNLEDGVRIITSETIKNKGFRTIGEQIKSHVAQTAQFLTWPFLFIFLTFSSNPGLPEPRTLRRLLPRLLSLPTI